MITIHRVCLWKASRAITAITLAVVVAGCGGSGVGSGFEPYCFRTDPQFYSGCETGLNVVWTSVNTTECRGEFWPTVAPAKNVRLEFWYATAQGEVQRVDGLDDLEQRRRAPRLVRLEVPHEVPAQARRGEIGGGRDLRLRLLDPVLAEVADTGGKGGAHRRRGVRLAHRDQPHLARKARRALRRPGDPLPDGEDALRDHFLSALSSPCAMPTFCVSVGFMLRYFSRFTIASGIFPWPTMSAPRR